MKTVSATLLKNRLGEVLREAALGPVGIERHGKVVAMLVPVSGKAAPSRKRSRWRRHDEERVVELCARSDFRPSRWARAGDARTLAGVAAMLASVDGFDRIRMLALAERLSPGMSSPDRFGQWLAETPIHAARFIPLVEARRAEARR